MYNRLTRDAEYDLSHDKINWAFKVKKYLHVDEIGMLDICINQKKYNYSVSFWKDKKSDLRYL